MLILFIPLILILLAPMLHIRLLSRISKNKYLKSRALITFLMVILGIGLSFLATAISMYGSGLSGIKCVTGSVCFVIFGTIISGVIIPLSSLIHFLSYPSKQKAEKSSMS